MSSLSCEKEGDFLKGEPRAHEDTRKDNASEEDIGSREEEGAGLDLLSFHAYIVPHSQRIARVNIGKHDVVSAYEFPTYGAERRPPL